MKNLKKYLALFMALVMAGSVMAACGSKQEAAEPAAQTEESSAQ